MTVLVALADLRDVVIVIYGILGIIFFFLAIVMIVAVGLTVKGLIKNVNVMLNDSVKPALASVQDVANTVRGTTDFVGRTTVAPIARSARPNASSHHRDRGLHSVCHCESIASARRGNP